MSIDLDAMIRLAGDHARTILIEQKQTSLMPIFMFRTGGDALGFIPAIGVDMDSGDAKEALADAVRGLMREQGAVAYSFVSEAWMAVLPPGAPRPRNVRDRPDRIEVVFAVAFDAAGDSRSGCWRMERNAVGKVTALNDRGSSGAADGFAGRFSYLLQARA